MKKNNSSEASEVSIEFFSRYSGIYPRPYYYPDSILNLQAEFEQLVKDFFSEASPDRLNASYLDKVIFQAEAVAKAEILAQRTAHRRFLQNLQNLYETEITYYDARISMIEDTLNTIEPELEKYEKLYNSKMNQEGD